MRLIRGLALFIPLFLLGCSRSETPPPTSRSAPRQLWQDDAAMFVEAVCRAAYESRTPPVLGITLNRNLAVHDSEGKPLWIVDFEPRPGTCQAELERQFCGRTIAWTVRLAADGIVSNAQVKYSFALGTTAADKTVQVANVVTVDTVFHPEIGILSSGQAVRVEGELPRLTTNSLYGVTCFYGCGTNEGKKVLAVDVNGKIEKAITGSTP